MQKNDELTSPKIQRKSVIVSLLNVLPNFVSHITVEIDSTKDKREGIPKVRNVEESNIAQILAPGSVSTAVGYATNANPIDLISSATGEPIPFKYPTTENTEKPAKKLNKQFPKPTLEASPIIGLSTAL